MPRESWSSDRRRRRRRLLLKQRERNFLAAACSMVIIVTLCTALAEPNWFSLQGGGCNMRYLGVYQFFYFGVFQFINPDVIQFQPLKESTDFVDGHKHKTVYHYSSDYDQTMVDCVTPKAVIIMRSIIALTFLGIISSVISFILDLFGPSSRPLKLIRRNAIGNILTVLICVVINGFCYWVTEEVKVLQKETRLHEGSKVEVGFDISFYLIAGAGAISVIATACNCLRRYPPIDMDDQANLLDDYEGLCPPGPAAPELTMLPPPPAYEP